MVKKTTRFDLASASSSLTTDNVCTLHISVRDVHGRLRIAVEKGALTTEVDEALFTSAKRRLSLLENGGWMKITGLHGETFKVPVDQSRDLPTVHFLTNEIAAACAAAVIPSCVQTAFTGRRRGEEKKSVGSREEADQEKRRKFLYLLHLRFAHSRGLRLLNILKEKGVGGGYTLKECSDVCKDCFACKAFNMRNRRIGRRRVRANRHERQKQKRKPKEPSKSDSQVKEETSEGSAERAPSLGDLSAHFNHEVVHDLTFPKQRGMGGEAGMSVIIDKSSRRVSLRSFKRKYESSRHLLSYHRRWEKKRWRVKEVFTDNGGEFVGEEYQETVERIGAALTLGPLYTLEAQAEVERVKQTMKRLLKKIILQLGVPSSCWPAFIPGVENVINETVHSTTRFSPNAVVHGVSEGVPPLAVGDVVRFLKKGPILSGLVPNNGESIVDSTDDQRERDGEGSEERHRDPSPTRRSPLNAVIKRHSSGALVPLQIVRGGQNVRNSLWGVRLDFDTEGNTSIKGAIEEVKLPEIQQRFRLPSDSRLPPEVLDRLVPPELPPSESGEGGGAGEFFPVDIDRDDSLFRSALLEEESRESSDGESFAGSLESAVDRDFFDKSESDMQEQLNEEIGGEEFAQYAKLSREQKREEALARLRFRRCFTVAKRSAFTQQQVKSLHAHARASKKENVAKGHILVTSEEIAAGSHKQSDSQELSRFFVCDVFDLDSQTDSQEEIKMKGITLRWVRTWKMKGGKRIAKSRLVARGFQDPRNQSVFETFSGTADSSLVRVALLFTVSMGWRGMKVDVATAFLQAPLDKSEAVWVKLPSDLPVDAYPGLKAGCFVRIQRAVYGLKDAPKKYTSFFKKKAQTVGWKEVAELIFLKTNKAEKPLAVMIMYVDDLYILSADTEKEMDLLKGLLQMDEPEYMDDGPGDLHTYVGLSVRVKEGEMSLEQSDYIIDMVSHLSSDE
uniref:Integrase catalytic domain-containing protein n=1 Tax=Chromera velia CCMP2878 TaxID=1169474 RepID=A0A0G4FJH1_9ALVE|eukprot:Cvel_17165.t1-p1 / transcript=Cvel_17165.t1 / gene=Cvel_17165 / organism=Chromera_velia_CCMP2878 / gene_product=Copia protein, putative / transcript_product=Copia protein, putative / location=Cvel_scaffold1356:41925-45069(-) / protein_length=957 / sequence_SO=supercontig / SO=protein_coding / is_pseudo=false